MADPRTPQSFITIDGDTVRDPATGGSIRLKGGANTPETAKEWKGQPGEPGAEPAKQAMDIAVNTLGYRPDGGNERDGYARGLQTFTSPSGADLSAGLITTGLATPHINPNYLDGAAGLAQHAETISQIAGEGHSPLMRDQGIRLLAQQASQERLSQFNQWISGANFDNSGAAKDLKWNENYFEGSDAIVDRALARGADNMQGMYYGFANALGEVVGSEKLSRLGAEGMARNMLQALENPATMASYEDPETYSDWFTYAVEAITEQVPQLATDLGVAVASMGGSIGLQTAAGAGKAALRSLGGSLATSAAPKLAASGLQGVVAAGKGGAALSLYAQLVGETQAKFVEEGIDNPELALAIGVPKAAMDYLGLHTVLSQGLKPLIGKQADATTVMAVLGNSLRAASIAAPAESLTEATQILMDELAVAGQKPGYEIDTKNIIEGMIKGGFAGGGIAGGVNLAGGAINKILTQPKNTDPVGDTAAEPLADLRAQIGNMPEGKIRHYTSQNVGEAQAIAEELGKVSRLTEGGQLQVANTQAELDALPANPTEADNARMLGYLQTKEEALADPAGAVAVVAKDENGGVIDSQIVGKSMAAQVAAQYQAQYQGATVAETTIDGAVTERVARRQAEQVLPNSPAPGKLREALNATKGEVAEAGKKAGKKVAKLKEKAAAPNPNVDDLGEAGVNEQNLKSAAPVDRAAVNRALTARLRELVPGTRKTLGDTLGTKRVRELTDKEADQLLRTFGVETEALPRARGEVSNASGQKGPGVDAAYRLAAARQLTATVREKVAGVGSKLRADLGSVAGFLGMEPDTANRKTYPSDEAYRTAVLDGVRAKYGSLREMAVELSKGEYSPAEVSDLLDALGAPQPAGFKFSDAEAKTSTAVKKAAAAERLPTADKPVPKAPEPAPKRVPKVASTVPKLLERVADSKVGQRIFSRAGVARSERGNKSLAAMFFDAGKREQILPDVMELQALGIDSDESVSAFIEYLDAVIEAETSNETGAALQITQQGEQEDGLQAESELVASQESSVDLDRVRALEASRKLFKAIQTSGMKLTTVKNGHPTGARAYVFALESLMQAEGGATAAELDAVTDEKTQAIFRTLTAVTAVLHGLGDTAYNPALFQDDLLAVTGLTDAALAGLADTAKGDTAVTPQSVYDALTRESGKHAGAARQLLQMKLPEDNAAEVLQGIMDALISPKAEVRVGALAELARVMEGVDLTTLRVTSNTRRAPGASKENPEAVTASASGVQNAAAIDKSEQQLSDWSFFSLLRRARAFFRPPSALRRDDNWRRKEGEPSVFDTHETWVVDFESFYDPDQGYSLSLMSNADYLRDPRYKTHGLAVAARGQETRYLTTQAEIEDFIASLRASEKPVALVAHNARFDADVMEQKFGFTPDVWIDTMELARTADPKAKGGHSLAAVAKTVGMEKNISSLVATSGKRDLATELTAEEYAEFITYAKDDTNIAFAFLEQNEPSMAFIAEADAALKAARGVPVGLSPEHFNFGDMARNGVAASALVTAKLGGRNLLYIRHRRSDGVGGEIVLPFDAVALAGISQSGTEAATTARQAVSNLQSALARFANGPEAGDVGVGLIASEIVVPHDDLVIFLSPDGPVTYGEAMAGVRDAKTRDSVLGAAERSQEKLRDRLGELDARANKFLATLAKLEQAESDDLRQSAIAIWMDRLTGSHIDDTDIENSDKAREYKTGDLLAEVNRLGANTNGAFKKGMPLSLADTFGETLRVRGELLRAGKTARKAKAEGAKGNAQDEEASARKSLADAANEVLLGRAVGDTIRRLNTQLEKLAATARELRSMPKRARNSKAIQANLDDTRGVERQLALALAAKEWMGENGKVYPSDIPQNEVDSFLRGDGFALFVDADPSVVADVKEGSDSPTESFELAADAGAERSELDQSTGIADAFRRDGVENRRDDGMAALFGKAEDTLAALKGRDTGARHDHRVFETEIGQPVAVAKQPGRPGAKAETDPDLRVPGTKQKLLGFENKLGRAYAFLTPFLTRLKQLNVPMDNITLLSREAAQAMLDAGYKGGVMAPVLGRNLAEALAEGGSAYFNHNGRTYILVSPDAANKQQVVEDVAHEIGHAVKDKVWGDLLAGERAALEAEFATAHPDAKADDTLLHEWFADQFMRAAVSKIAKQEQPSGAQQKKSTVAKAIGEILSVVRKVWEAVKQMGEPGVEFSAFAERLFAGGYNHIGVKSISDTTLRFASGADQLTPQDVNRGQMAVNRVKQGFKKGVVPSLRSLLGTAIGRMEVISPELASMLFQRANSDSRGTRAYEQTNIALSNRMMAEKDRLIASLSNKKGKARTAEVQAALGDAFTGAPKTVAGQKARAALNALADLAKAEGLRSTQFASDFPIAVFDREMVERNRADFTRLLVEGMKITPAQASEIVVGIVEGIGSMEGAIAPGLPVGAHVSSRAILKAIPYTKLREGGWLLQEHEAALQHWVGGVAKRTAWEKTFGGFAPGNAARMAKQVFGEADPTGERLLEAGLMTEDGEVFNPSAKFHAELEKVRLRSGEQAVEQFMNLLDGVMGRTGANMPRGLRTSQDFVMASVNWMTLAFSGVASIPEIGTAFVRAGGRVGLSDMMGSMREARQMADALGVVLSSASQRIVWQATGEQYQAPLAQKMNFWLFKLNGNQMITNFSRTVAVGVGMQYLSKAAADGDHAALARLNIDAATVRVWEANGRKAPSLEQSDTAYAINARVADALSQFVSEATVAPSRFQATHWGNNPYFKLVWHLKHFMYAYADTILGGMWRDAKRRFRHLDGNAFNRAVMAAAPAVLFAIVVMPLAAGALELRDWLRRLNGTRIEERTAMQYFVDTFDRAGGLGPLAFVAGAYRAQADYGVSLFGSLSPTLGKLDMLFTDYLGDGQINREELMWKARQLTPIAAQNKALWPFE